MTSPDQVVVATVNTFFGRAVREPDGLQEVALADILLLQELYAPQAAKKDLERLGFKLVGIGGHFGLAIAVRQDGALRYKQGTVREVVFQKISPLGVSLTNRYARQQSEYADRGVLVAKFITKGGVELTLATTHLPVVTAPRKRAQFLKRLKAELEEPYYDGSLILAGDMNHWPGPKAIDLAFRESAGLSAADLGGAITWPSKHTGFLESKLGRLYGGQFDDMLYRGRAITLGSAKVVDVLSDHRAVVGTFVVGA